MAVIWRNPLVHNLGFHLAHPFLFVFRDTTELLAGYLFLFCFYMCGALGFVV
jgi:hypothetical protein